MGIKEHYDGHLANYYTWIYGGFEKKAEDNKIFFSLHDIKPTTSKIVIDLGAGSGFQSIPLLDLGFEVISVDISQKLLKELRSRTINNTKLSIIESDILEFKSYNNRRPELIICMGDT
ncbi:methyltransferase domain-containing protein, partial [Candidatus Desantisbacteria bacterium]|nr:methyltransferase domain-containing protein [Candidatus Desantisbacteria bacterium]